ncbi:hypothetical protein ACR77J_04660 [Tissierella praeacuta]|uniref:hypothetical protein n=1 Tax=Tissierella praeacuta TaxID=43131 RepID=UPI003DA3DF96
MDKKYYIVRNKYLAEGMAFLGFRYMKFGFGKDAEYSFEDTKEFRDALAQILQLKKNI